jgi:aquaporin Z
VNPARSTGVALYVGDWAVAQLWLFWLAPLVGGPLGAFVYRYISDDKPAFASESDKKPLVAATPGV